MCDCDQVFPNADVRLVRADLSNMATIRLSDLLSQPIQKESRWVSLSENLFEQFILKLYRAGLIEIGEEIWWSPGPVCNLLSKRMEESKGVMDLTYPLKNEKLINGWNFRETVEKAYETFYKSVDLENDDKSRKLRIISFTMVIRPHRIFGEYRAPTELDPQFVGVVRQSDGKDRRSQNLPWRNRKPTTYQKNAHDYCHLMPMEACTCGP